MWISEQIFNLSKSNIYIYAKLSDETAKIDGRKLNEEKPKVFTVRDKHKTIRAMLKLKATLDSFSIKQLSLDSGVGPHVSDKVTYVY